MKAGVALAISMVKPSTEYLHIPPVESLLLCPNENRTRAMSGEKQKSVQLSLMVSAPNTAVQHFAVLVKVLLYLASLYDSKSYY
jgi:hypothetical protein